MSLQGSSKMMGRVRQRRRIIIGRVGCTEQEGDGGCEKGIGQDEECVKENGWEERWGNVCLEKAYEDGIEVHVPKVEAGRQIIPTVFHSDISFVVLDSLGNIL
jgi:hypothetical protein